MFTTKAMGETTITANARNGSMACSRLGSGPLAGRSVLVVCSILFAFALALVGALGIAHPQAALADDSEHVTAVKTLVDSLGADTLGDKQFLLKVAAPAGEEIASLSDEQERTIEQLMGYVLDSEKDDAGRTGAVVLSADEEAALDATSPADYAKKDYGRILQEIQWAYLSRSTDAKATLLDDTYASGQISATSTSGKYQPTTQRFWVLSNIAVSGGIATATLQTDPESTGYTKLVTGGKLYTNQAASGENARFDNVEIALGTTTRIVVESGKYGCYAYSISSSIDRRIGDAAQKAIENASALIDKLPTELSTGAQIAGIQQTLTEALAAYQALPDEQKEALASELQSKLASLKEQVAAYASSLQDTPTPLATGKKFSEAKVSYLVNGTNTVTLVACKSTKKSLVLDSVTHDGIRYTITCVAAKAFAGAGKLTKVTLGTNVGKLAAKAFAKSKVRTIVVKSKKLASKARLANCLKSSKVKTVKLKSLGTKKKAVKKAFKNYAGKKNLVFA